ncbi:YcxB family protein [Microbulbifer sp. VAAF005]|uniref:YcxB family protein n=1 Tax=Microbulbifer sp. VAAF005 TaxID=3034230 RepID=UPI0024ACCA16|nr:YcxB family protein [Microbulbifer sp. VAAF005]WHI48424.1 YcxB family protein [Microbulbifer sp. VAAF005]
MNIDVNITKEDFLTYSRFACSRIVSPKSSNSKNTGVNLIIWICIAFGFLFLLNYYDIKLSQLHWPSAIFATIPFLIFTYLFMRNMKRIELGSIPRDDGLVVGKRVLEFSNDGIKDTCELGHFFYKWKAVQEIVSHNGSIYLFLDTLLAQIIPKSSFKNESEHNEILEYINTIHNKAINRVQ